MPGKERRTTQAAGFRRGPGARKRASRRGGVVFKLLMLLVIVAAFASLAWMLFLPLVFVERIQERTGFGATVESVVANPFTGRIEMRGLRVTNPPAFPRRAFFELRHFEAQGRIWSFWGERPEFDAMSIHVAEVCLVARENGLTNVDAFRQSAMRGTGWSGQPERARAFLIRELKLKIDRVLVSEPARAGGEREIVSPIDQTFRDVTELEQVLTTPLLRELEPVAVVLAELASGDFGASLRQSARRGADVLKATGDRAGEAARGFFETLEESKKP